jgi:hypothetical protein
MMRGRSGHDCPAFLPCPPCDEILDSIDQWDSTSYIPLTNKWDEDPIIIQTDASTTDGGGAVLFENLTIDLPIKDSITKWFYYKWPNNTKMKEWNIHSLELAAIAIALNNFGPRLTGKRVTIHSDSMNSVNAIDKQASKSFIMLRLLRAVHAIAFQFDFHIRIISHIRGTHNVFADIASRLSSQTPWKLKEHGLVSQKRIEITIPLWLHTLAMHSDC